MQQAKPLGRGHYGVVRRCVNISTGEEFAIKTIRKARVSRVESLLREVEILRKVEHPNIIALVDVYEDEANLHLVRYLKEEGWGGGGRGIVVVSCGDVVRRTIPPRVPIVPGRSTLVFADRADAACTSAKRCEAFGESREG